MSPGNFSNGGVDTFDAAQALRRCPPPAGRPAARPRLERARRHPPLLRATPARALRGRRRPDLDGFQVRAPDFRRRERRPHRRQATARSRASTSGTSDEVLFSEQGDRRPASRAPNSRRRHARPLPRARGRAASTRTDRSRPPQRAGREHGDRACATRCDGPSGPIRRPALPPPDTYVLAEITRSARRHADPARADHRPPAHDAQPRRCGRPSRLARRRRLDALEDAVQHGPARHRLDAAGPRTGCFWDVRVETSTPETLFGGQGDRSRSPSPTATVTPVQRRDREPSRRTGAAHADVRRRRPTPGGRGRSRPHRRPHGRPRSGRPTSRSSSASARRSRRRSPSPIQGPIEYAKVRVRAGRAGRSSPATAPPAVLH